MTTLLVQRLDSHIPRSASPSSSIRCYTIARTRWLGSTATLAPVTPATRRLARRSSSRSSRSRRPYSSLDALEPDVVWVEQETHRELVLTRLGPTHVPHRFLLSELEEEISGHAAETIDSAWRWDFKYAGETRLALGKR
jgi:hypothetical protein